MVVGCDQKSGHLLSGLRSPVELRMGPVSGDIEVSGNTTKQIHLSSQVQDMTLVFSILLSGKSRHGEGRESTRRQGEGQPLSVGSSGVQAAPGGAGDQRPVGTSLFLSPLGLSAFPPRLPTLLPHTLVTAVTINHSPCSLPLC